MARRPIRKLPTDISRLKSRQIVDMDIANLSNADIAKVLTRAVQLAEKRIGQIERNDLFSPALDKYIGDTPVTDFLPSEGAKRGTLQHRFAVVQTFLQAKTSTVQGIRKVAQERNERIFGVQSTKTTETGFKDTEEERRYWHAYNEFMHQNSQFYAESTRVQQMLGKMTFWRNREFTARDLNRLLSRMEESQEPTYANGEVERNYREGNYQNANVRRGRDGDWNTPNK